MIQTYPEDCVQSTIVPPGKWWVEAPSHGYECGRLVKAFIPHVDQLPYVILEEGRREAAIHNVFQCKIEPLNIKQPQKKAKLPVAGIPVPTGEIRAIYRAKKRPALIVATAGKMVAPELILGKPKRNTAPTLLVAPYYGADEDDQRAGYSQAFRDRVRKCEYPQFMMDWLPIAGSPAGSILRIDHIQPVGFHHASLEQTQWRLSADALDVLYEWIEWHFEGSLPEGGVLEYQIQLNMDLV